MLAEYLHKVTTLTLEWSLQNPDLDTFQSLKASLVGRHPPEGDINAHKKHTKETQTSKGLSGRRGGDLISNIISSI